MKQALHIFGTVLYTALVVCLLAFALLFVGTKIDLLGYEVKIVQSGSMEPAIQTGGIVVIAPAASYQVGDVVTFGRDTRAAIPVTHRIVEKTSESGRTTYLTKGDANEEADSRSVAESAVIGRVAFSMPYVGYALEFARTPLGFGLLVGVPALLIVLDEFANIMWEIHKWRHRVRKHQGGKQKQKSGKRAGPTGYRTPSRNRQPRDFPKEGRTTPRLVPSTSERPERPKQNLVLDLRSYPLKQQST